MVIGVSGKIGSGKDLVGQIIEYVGHEKRDSSFNRFEDFYLDKKSVYDSHWIHKKFADALKDNVCRLLGVDRDKLEDRDYKETPLGEEWWYYNLGSKIVPYGSYEKDSVDERIANDRFLVKPTPRFILQRLGTEGVRDTIHPNAWVNAAIADYKPQAATDIEGDLIYPNWYFTDMRFPNELDAVARLGGITIRVYRGGANTGNHESEVALDGYLNRFDYVIDNNGTIEELFDKVKQIMIDFNLI